jgi:hypothetical protein
MGPRPKPQQDEPPALPPELLNPDAGDILDVDGEKYLRWLETGEGEDPCRDSYDLTPGYTRGARRLGVHAPGTTRLKVAAEIRALAEAFALPLAGDVSTLVPPTLAAYVHPVPGTPLWLWYTATAGELTLRGLTSTAPG